MTRAIPAQLVEIDIRVNNLIDALRQRDFAEPIVSTYDQVLRPLLKQIVVVEAIKTHPLHVMEEALMLMFCTAWYDLMQRQHNKNDLLEVNDNNAAMLAIMKDRIEAMAVQLFDVRPTVHLPTQSQH